MQIPMAYQQQAIEIIKRKVKDTSGHDPRGIALGGLYIILFHTPYKKYQRELSQIANITEVTIRNKIRVIST